MGKIPQREEMRHGVRVVEHALPEVAIRELLANAMTHQDLSQSAGPVIEIFSDRVTITNTGEPIVPIERFIDTPSRSRNPMLAQMMRDLKLCEERGSGVDRALAAIEAKALPPPLFTAVAGSTLVTLYMERPFAAMSRTERLRACYQHACLRQQANDFLSNGSLRHRFGLAEGQYAQVSRVIAEAIEAGLIKPLDENQGARNARYIPHWFNP
jgi:ATP-dependent DNA helicase RecG